MRNIVKRFISLIASVALIFGVIGIAGYAAESDIAVSLSSTTCNQDDEITAKIYFPRLFNSAASLDMSLIYDSQKLEVVKVTQGKGLRKARDKQPNGEVFSESHKVAGSVRWCLAGSNNYEFTDDFAEVVFKVKPLAEHGECNLRLQINEAANSGYVVITDQVSVSGATFNILRNTINDLSFKLNDAGNGYIITDYLCMTYDTVVIPSEYKGLPVVGIDYAAFMNHSEIKSLTLPSSLEYIGKSSFCGCSGIEELVIPAGVTKIDESAFERCDGLKKVTFPVGLQSIGMSAFKSCYRLLEIELPFTLTKLGDIAFSDCYSLNRVKISKNTTIGKKAFASCDDKLTFVTVENNVRLSNYITNAGISPELEYVKDLSLGKLNKIEEQQYSGSALTPAVSLTLDSGEKVAIGTDYNVIYLKNTAVGTAKVYVEGIKDYGEGYITSFVISCKHPEVSKSVSKEATCTEKGNYIVTCKLCGEKFNEEIPAKGHTAAGNWIIDRRPTITQEGLKHQICRTCGKNTNITLMPKAYPDLDGNGSINSSDALMVLQYSVGLASSIKTDDKKINADTNGDGNINSVDALTILKIAVDMITI